MITTSLRNFFFLFIFIILPGCIPGLKVVEDLTNTIDNNETETSSKPEVTLERMIPSISIHEPTPTVTQTPEKFQIKSKIPFISKDKIQEGYNPYEQIDLFKKKGFQFTAGYSLISFEDLISGKILEKEKLYANQHALFSGEVKNDDLRITGASSNEFEQSVVALSTDYSYTNNPTKRFVTLVSMYRIEDDEFFRRMGVNLLENINSPHYGMDIESMTEKEKRNAESMYFWLLTWAYQNPKGDVKFIHMFIENLYLFVLDYYRALYSVDPICEYGSSRKPVFLFDFKMKLDSDEVRKENYYVLALIYQTHPELKPDTSLIRDWVKTNEFPEELQNKLFGYGHGGCW